ncbi:MAG: hypothetical protein A2X36_13905 [Elusimicrobia bacterium GWA2_69_24]|nr:MAG: hypothetical protein A2X36_13905 [Elusimicrobia bacterium GWA2_69_24]HBL16707.1 mannanase [Elusimicrobiota bacterium]
MLTKTLRLACLLLLTSQVSSAAARGRATEAAAPPGFVTVRGAGFEIDGKPYRFLGTNLWYGMNLASRGPGGDRARLLRELDRLSALGVKNLRIVAASEGPDTEPWRMAPALQKKPGVYDKELLDGLDFLLAEMGQRDMRAVVVLNDFWHWSGGMAQYVSWSQGLPIPYPPPAAGGDWDVFQRFAARFYSDPKAMKRFRKLVKRVVTRKNGYTRRRYRDDPTIMAWQLANEPRGTGDPAGLQKWIDETARYIKSLDPVHLVTTGCEGETPGPAAAGLDFLKNHAGPDIDYATMHIWVQNWGWYDPALGEDAFEEGVRKMSAYFSDHEAKARRLGKPLVLEEFGLARDVGSFEPAAEATTRNRYFVLVFQKVAAAAAVGSPVAGVNFWAWSGEGRPVQPGGVWKPGQPFTGDPPHESQGWYGVYDSDAETLRIVSDWTRRLTPAAKGTPDSGVPVSAR